MDYCMHKSGFLHSDGGCLICGAVNGEVCMRRVWSKHLNKMICQREQEIMDIEYEIDAEHAARNINN